MSAVRLFSLVVAACLIDCVVPQHGVTTQPPGRAIEAFPAPDEPDAAEAYERAKRLNGTSGVNPRQKYEEAAETLERRRRPARVSETPLARAEASSDSPSLGTWEPLGPGNIGGRTRAILIDPADSRTIYAAGVSGGVWKSEDRGESWRPIGDELANISVNSLLFGPAGHQTIYAGTGEGYFREEVRGTGLPLRGGGIFVTRDGGESWSRLESTSGEDFYWVNDLVASPHDPNRIYAATRTGVWRSSNGGESWSRALDPAVKGGCLDLAIRTDTDDDYLFASCGTLAQASVYRQSHAENDEPWERVLSASGMGRTSLAIAPSSQSVIYALAASNLPGPGGRFNQGLLAVYRSESSGDPGSWQTRTSNQDPDVVDTLLLTNAIAAVDAQCRPDDPDARSFNVTMGWYVNVIAVDPTNPERVWAAGVDLFRSDDGGRNWGPASYWWPEDDPPGFVHADQHTIVFDPGWDGRANQTLYLGNDGGVYRTTNALERIGTGLASLCDPTRSLVRWEALNHGYAVTQFYHGAVFPDGRSYLGGAQDNGTLLGTDSAGIDGWRWVSGGDGAFVAIDSSDTRNVYAESQWGYIVRSTDGGDTFALAIEGIQDSGFLFVTPIAIDPQDPSRLWTGGSRIWRTDNRAVLWSAASVSIPPTAGSISAIAVAPGLSDRVIAGTSLGRIYRTDSAQAATSSTSWSSSSPRSGWVSSIAFQPTNPEIVYATYAGFGGAHIWKSIDGGRTWNAVDGEGDGALPDIPVHAIVVDPARAERLFIGTDLGVFVTIDGGTTWVQENNGFANVVTEWLTLARGDSGPSLYAFTHGRGVWRAPLYGQPLRRRGLHP